KQMPMGMHTVISEGAGTISGGQKQRLMIARAIIKKPKLIFFDEATSALDNRTQAIVSNSLDQLQATRVVIAHRLSTIIHCNKIIVMDQGKIVESGTYQELIENKGIFADLAKRQLA
ncbi:MAG TPA: NHLP bacteriocin export ABC transporter permease/ATPase subunit, partial [Desulfosporosinus sp.]|nr:NHLP bacteriocin export ABC transporter permease/ATPase subunit [Desulfosporosinus sp.]